ENHLQAELQLPHRGLCGGDGAEAAAARDGLAGSVEAVVSQYDAGVAPVRMIRKVEGLEAKLEVSLLREVETSQRGKFQAMTPGSVTAPRPPLPNVPGAWR